MGGPHIERGTGRQMSLLQDPPKEPTPGVKVSLVYEGTVNETDEPVWERVH